MEAHFVVLLPRGKSTVRVIFFKVELRFSKFFFACMRCSVILQFGQIRCEKKSASVSVPKIITDTGRFSITYSIFLIVMIMYNLPSLPYSLRLTDI